jgi:acetyltransferase
MKREANEISKFLNPKSIAIIGASEHPEKVGGILANKLLKFKGKIIFINPHDEIIAGKKCYPSVLNYPNKIDMAIIATPAETIKKIIKQCGKKHIKNIIIISAGFSEVGNFKLENKIKKLILKYKMNVLGPNCFGIANPYLNLDSTFANTSPKKGHIAFISQSGALWSYISDLNLKKGEGFSCFVSLGNMLDLSFEDFIEYFNKDKKTKKIILYIEKLKNGKEFIKICRHSKKQIIIIKAGKTERGKQAAVSHTGSLATDYEIYKGAFSQAKVKVVNSIAEALNINEEKIIEKNKKANKEKVAIITNAGGAGAILTDYLENRGFRVESLVDLLGTAQYRNYLEELDKKQYNKFKKIFVILTPQTMSQPEETAEILIQSHLKNKIIAIFLGENSIRQAVKILKNSKVPVYTRI